jgi:hypothetical protein
MEKSWYAAEEFVGKIKIKAMSKVTWFAEWQGPANKDSFAQKRSFLSLVNISDVYIYV